MRDKIAHDITETPYGELMAKKERQYTALIRQAERTSLQNNEEPTKEEALLYLEAAKVCEEIMNMNLSQRSTYAWWKERKNDCESEAERITDIIRPRPAKPGKPTRGESELTTDQSASGGQPLKAPGTGTAVSYKEKGRVWRTASGFETRNVVDGVSAEMIESWYQEEPRKGFEAITGMKEVIERLQDEVASLGWDRTDEVLELSPAQIYFFYGPPGSGKTFLINAFAKEMMNKGFNFLRLSGADIHSKYVGVAEKIVNAAFQEAIDNEPCILFIDEVDNVCPNRGSPKAENHTIRLTNAFLEARNNLRLSGKRVIFLGATNFPGNVDEAMMDSAKLIRFPLPSEEARAKFFHKTFEMLTLEDGFTCEEMAEATENYSYRDLEEKLTNTIKLELKKQVIRDYGGSLEREWADIEGSEAIKSGRIRLTRALFQEAKAKNIPAPKTDIRRQLEEFEAHITCGT